MSTFGFSKQTEFRPAVQKKYILKSAKAFSTNIFLADKGFALPP